MSVRDRKAVREAIAALFVVDATIATLVDVTTSIHAYQKEMLKTSPSIVVTADGSQRRTHEGNILPKAYVYLAIHTFVEYEPGGTTEQDSDDMIDLLEAAIIDVLEVNSDKTNDLSALWEFIDIIEDSSVEVYTDINGKDWRHEVIPIRATVYNYA